MKDSSLCPYRKHNGLVLECDYADCLCKRGNCPYFPTLEQAKSAYQHSMQEAGETLADTIAKMKQKIKDAKRITKLGERIK